MNERDAKIARFLRRTAAELLVSARDEACSKDQAAMAECAAKSLRLAAESIEQGEHDQ